MEGGNNSNLDLWNKDTFDKEIDLKRMEEISKRMGEMTDEV